MRSQDAVSGTDVIADAWREAREKSSGIKKETFVRNCLFSCDFDLTDLGRWIMEQDDLADQVWQGGSDCYLSMIPTKGDDGHTWWKADPNGPRVVVRVELETLRRGGKAKSEAATGWDDNDF